LHRGRFSLLALGLTVVEEVVAVERRFLVGDIVGGRGLGEIGVAGQPHGRVGVVLVGGGRCDGQGVAGAGGQPGVLGQAGAGVGGRCAHPGHGLRRGRLRRRRGLAVGQRGRRRDAVVVGLDLVHVHDVVRGLRLAEDVVDAHDAVRPGRPGVVDDGGVALHPHPATAFR